jgi:excisionase family DNA binding protein
MSQKQQFLSVPSTASELNLSRSRVWQLVKAGRLEATRVSGNSYIITRHELERFKKECSTRVARLQQAEDFGKELEKVMAWYNPKETK